MANGDETIAALREALKHSPSNAPLRLHLADTLMSFARYEEAEKEYRAGISEFAGDVRFKLGLGRAFYQGGKHSAAMVVVEELMRQPNPPAAAMVLHSRLLFKAGEVDRAVRQYKRAIDQDDSVADADWARQLGIHAMQEEADEAEVVDGRVRGAATGDGHGPDVSVERPKVNFDQVGGMDALKDEIWMKIIHPMAHPELYAAYGKKIGGGILMYGPPGCGKTHLARATAGQIKAGFLSIGINDVLDMWLGNSEKNLHEVFDRARRSKPCVLFFDEVDALASSRADMKIASSRHVINQFLSEMDGIAGDNDGLLILAATNAPWHVDSAFRRPGRFDRILFVPPPDATARAGILRILLNGKPVETIDYDLLAKKTPEFSGADLKAVVDHAIEEKLRQAMKEGIPKPLTTKDLQTAAAAIRPSTREWFATARNYALYSNQGGVYDDILKYMKL